MGAEPHRAPSRISSQPVLARSRAPRWSGRLAAVALLLAFGVPLGNSPSTAGEGPAFDTLRRMGRGVNILGYDGIWDGGVDAPFKQSYFKLIHDAGFRHVRINLHAFKHMNGAGEIEPKVLERLDWVLDQAIRADLVPVLDEHDFTDCQSRPDDCAAKVARFWTQLSARYAGRFPAAVFELLNEPGGQMTAPRWNALAAKLLGIIRANNPQRTVVVAAINSEDPQEVRKLELPARDRNIIASVHYYKPIEFTHQGAEWSRKFSKLSGIDWGSDGDERKVVADLAMIDDWARSEGRPVYLGEFGVYERANLDARVRYTAFLARTAERLGWSWAYWQFDHDFALFRPERDEWVKPILDALLPRKPAAPRR